MDVPKRSPELGAKPTEVYGFICAIVSVVTFFVYMAWAYIPEPYLQAAGITYYPSKYWAIALPSYLCVTIILGQVFYMGLNHLATPSPDSLMTITDSHARKPVPNLGFSEETQSRHRLIPPISDLPLTDVNKILYG